MKSYKDLEVYQKAFDLAINVHELSLKLPKYELYETGSQLRRASKSVVANIVEGYGRRKYKADFLKFLTYSHASCLETIVHLNLLIKTHKNLADEIDPILAEYEILGARLYSFIKYVSNEWLTQNK